ncbi:autotransporter outer membrane beta-barrel domain-containing protein [Devosia sp. A16]|uniref:autotransporter outer membrane beta-barrel domain-containing protein n=1 Tax=Devosia sp. A16 TaxID=1736675 RepID=UPI000B328673|nr:autotransporter domain-containing protein [Devosia sp. A16]
MRSRFRGALRHPSRLRTQAVLAALLGSSMLAGLSAPAMAEEPWIMVQRTFFLDADPARGQGVTTDGTNWYFSGTHSLEITDETFSTIRIDTDAILSQVGLANGYTDVTLNHIGDIDYANGKLYISLDSTQRDPITGNKYSNPVFAVYDAATLTWTGEAYTVNPPNGIKDIASWVAVDAEAGLAYGMAYDNATELAVYNLADFSFKQYIPLSQVVDQAQGGKLLNGYMYFATDNDEKLLMRANLVTGEVETIGNLKIDGEQEVEGLSIRWTGDGWSMNVLNREESTPGSGEEGVGFYKYLRPTGNTLSGEIHADIGGALLTDSRVLREATLRRMNDFTAPSDGPVFWGEALASRGRTDAAGDAASFEQRSAGFIGGVESTLGDWLVGLSAGYGRTSFSVTDRASSATSDTYQFGVYAGTHFGDLGLKLGAGLAAHDIATERSVVFPAFSERLSAEYAARTLQAYGELDYRFDLGAALLSPFAGLALVSHSTDAFEETGGTNAALSAGRSSDQNAFTTLGLRVTAPLDLGEATGKLHAQVGWQHALADTQTAIELAIPTGASFDSVGVPIAKDALSLEAGLDLALSADATLTASYSGQLAESAQNHSVKLGFGVRF